MQEGRWKWQSGDLRDAPDEDLDIIRQKLQQALKETFMQQRKSRVREAEDAKTRMGSCHAVSANPQEAEDVIM